MRKTRKIWALYQDWEEEKNMLLACYVRREDAEIKKNTLIKVFGMDCFRIEDVFLVQHL